MSELERKLSALAAEVEWPQTPELALRLESERLRARPSRRRLALVVALVLVAVALALAVSPARSSIMRFFHLGGVTVERVETLPDAELRALTEGLGEPVSRDQAEAAFGGSVALPPGTDDVQLYERDGVVSAVLATPEPVLLSELRPAGGASLLKKVAGLSTGVEHARIDEATEGLWIVGAPHVVYWLQAPPRLAGNVLLWERDGVTYRLEGKTLTKERAVELARELDG